MAKTVGIAFAWSPDMKYARPTLLSLAIAALVTGCFLGHRNPGPPPSDVAVTVAGVSLADECAPVAARCAPEPVPPESEAPAGDAAGAFAPCDGPCCGSLCQQSSVTLAIDADGDAPVSFRIQRATLLTADGSEVATLRTDTPRIWSDGGYVTWDEVIATPSRSQVLYDLRDLSWGDPADSYRTTYRLRLDIEVDGEERTITSEETTREAPIVT